MVVRDSRVLWQCCEGLYTIFVGKKKKCPLSLRLTRGNVLPKIRNWGVVCKPTRVCGLSLSQPPAKLEFGRRQPSPSCSRRASTSPPDPVLLNWRLLLKNKKVFAPELLFSVSLVFGDQGSMTTREHVHGNRLFRLMF